MGNQFVKSPSLPRPKKQQTKMLVTCQKFGDLFLFGLIWQYSSNHKTYNKGTYTVNVFPIKVTFYQLIFKGMTIRIDFKSIFVTVFKYKHPKR